MQASPFTTYGPDDVLQRVFTGGPAEAAACRAELTTLGDSREGDRLRSLIVRLVQLLQGRAYPHHGNLIWSSGRPMTMEEIADAVTWDRERIAEDLESLMSVGLIETTAAGAARKGVN